MTIEHRRILMKAFIGSQFGYSPLASMYCNWNCNNRINHLHKRALRIIYNDSVSSFEDLLQIYLKIHLLHKSFSIHHRNIRLLEIELCKTRKNISCHIMNELFEQRNIIYNLRSQTDFTTGPISTVNNGQNNLRYLGPKIWNNIPLDIRNSGNIEKFTRKIKCWLLKIILVSYVFITSIALGMSIIHIFGTSHSEVLCQIERVLILAGGLPIASSALTSYSWLSFLCVFNYMFLGEKCNKKLGFTIVKFNVFNSFCSRCTLLLPPENIRSV